MNAVEKAREIDELKEVDKKEKLFVVQPLSENTDTYFLDLREDKCSFYGYGDQEQIPEERLKDEPEYVKTVRSFKMAEGSKTLDSFA